MYSAESETITGSHCLSPFLPSSWNWWPSLAPRTRVGLVPMCSPFSPFFWMWSDLLKSCPWQSRERWGASVTRVCESPPPSQDLSYRETRILGIVRPDSCWWGQGSGVACHHWCTSLRGRAGGEWRTPRSVPGGGRGGSVVSSEWGPCPGGCWEGEPMSSNK